MITSLYWRWDRYFTNSEINDINSAAMTHGIVEPDKYKGKGKNCDTVTVGSWDRVPALFKLKIEVVNRARKEYGYDLFDDMGYYDWIHNNYKSDINGSYPWHTDLSDSIYIDMKISCIVNTSTNDYEGGNFYLLDSCAEPVHVPELDVPGSAIMFPSRTLHKVDPVTRGERSSVVFFLHGPHWR